MSLSKLMKVARESIETAEVSAEELAAQQEALQDTSLTVDVIDEVQAPAAELEQGMTDVEAAEAEAEALDSTAEALNASLAAGEGEAPGQGVDPVAAGLVADQIQEAVERFALGQASARPARESFATSAGRREVTLSLAKEAGDTAKALRDRAIAAIKKAIEWLKELIKTVVDKAERVAKRAQALGKVSADAKEGGQDLKINGSFLGGKSATEVADGLVKLPASFDKLSDMVVDKTGAQLATLDLNPDNVGNVAMRLEVAGDKISFVKEAGETAEGTAKSLSAAECGKVAAAVYSAAASVRNHKKHFDAVTAKSLSVISAIKSGENNAERMAMVASVNAVTRAAAALVSLTLGTGSRLLDLVDASIAAGRKAGKGEAAQGEAAAA